MSILTTKCNRCLHSEVCNLQEQVKYIQDSMRVTIEDCDHFLSEVNWIGSSEDDEEEEDTVDYEETACDLWESIMKELRDYKNAVKPKELGKYPLALSTEEEINPILIKCLEELIEYGKEPKEIVVSTVQLERLFSRYTLQIMDASKLRVRMKGLSIPIRADDTIDISYIKYETVEHKKEEPVKSEKQDAPNPLLPRKIVASVDHEDIIVPIIRCVDELLENNNKPVSVTMTTRQFKCVLGRFNVKGVKTKDNCVVTISGCPLEVRVNENITHCYIRYKEGK